MGFVCARVEAHSWGQCGEDCIAAAHSLTARERTSVCGVVKPMFSTNYTFAKYDDIGEEFVGVSESNTPVEE